MSPMIYSLMQCAKYVSQSMVVSYPTESVFGLGCNPNSQIAVKYLLSLKKRSVKKGLILVSANYKQLIPWIADEELSDDQRSYMFSRWPGPVTWIVPARPTTPFWLRGQFTTIAVRVSNHPTVISLCKACNTALVSTSANLTGFLPCRGASEVIENIGNHIPVLVGQTSGHAHPSEIRNLITGELIRGG
ncbi:Sua5/YciO/YrdC/YwlC family protein [Candidatus Erwinia haradaeae]|uniref:Threonylcarbamoyl-AMP synthase n=1 Tax=Candidatus Erwinia haradaeae TaxID=1922217 RepID=A0A451D8W6_9GAMM|nr:Sua5/YciO/YrdC/YwlC family protein [Candidatus Erwinia haradaeae]VFP82291.1 Threonylcarbamoyl-AMP synthase [Candidatus Erwinia haradaeae]